MSQPRRPRPSSPPASNFGNSNGQRKNSKQTSREGGTPGKIPSPEMNPRKKGSKLQTKDNGKSSPQPKDSMPRSVLLNLTHLQMPKLLGGKKISYFKLTLYLSALVVGLLSFIFVSQYRVILSPEIVAIVDSIKEDSQLKIYMKLDEIGHSSFISSIREFFPSPSESADATGSALNMSVRPGQVLYEQGLRAQYPVILIPGFITSQLEVWQGEPCVSADMFHRTAWGGVSMVEFMLRDAACWSRHLALNLTTGLDQEGIKLRAVHGLHGIDYLFPGYWVFGKLIQNLADIGMESRDKYFSRLMESVRDTSNQLDRKICVIAHSMGGVIWHYFTRFAENKEPGFIDKYIHAYIPVAVPSIGAPKGFSAFISGEMKDTAQLELLRASVADNMIRPIERLLMFRSWGSIANLMPRGSDEIWSDKDGKPITFLHLRETATQPEKNLTFSETFEFLREQIASLENGSVVLARLDREFYHGYRTPKEGFPSTSESKYWGNAMATPLPDAPQMKIYCLYGTGMPTEEGYYYYDQEQGATGVLDRFVSLEGIRYAMDTRRDGGVVLGEGDATIPLLSLGLMCNAGWKNDFYNPSRIKVVTREYPHQSDGWLSLRGGRSGDHVDVLGNVDLIADILRIVAGQDAALADRVESGIDTRAHAILQRLLHNK